MSKKTDWRPSKRSDQLVMCRNWITVMSDTEVRTAWGIPPAQFTELGTVYSTAQAKLQLAQSSERTAVITEQCREAFEAMVSKMRFFHGHYFLLPPLDKADIVSLGLTPRDEKPTRMGKPTAEVKAEEGRGAL